MARKLTVTLRGGPRDGQPVNVDAGAVPYEVFVHNYELLAEVPNPDEDVEVHTYRRQLEDDGTITYRYVGKLKRGNPRGGITP